jgi:hypothetical protein
MPDNLSRHVMSALKIVLKGIQNRSALTLARAAICVLFGVQLGCAGTSERVANAPWPAPVASQEPRTIRISTEREGDSTHFFVENDELSEITMTFEMGLVNMKGDVSFPHTATFAPGRKTEAFTLSPAGGSGKWEYCYTNYYKLGSQVAKHDDSFLYRLPYAPGDKYKVTQGYNGKFSHTGANQYAIDWDMPMGTLVYAARGGVVVRVKQDSDRGGASRAFDPYNNYVLIRHDDGTLGHYCHLLKNGCLVKEGQVVSIGEPIAHSGSTGFSSGPHLHFSVFKTRNGRERESLPVKFEVAAGQGMTLVSGKSYRSGTQAVSAQATPTKDNRQAQDRSDSF